MQIEHTENRFLKPVTHVTFYMYMRSTVIESVISKILLCFAADVTCVSDAKTYPSKITYMHHRMDNINSSNSKNLL